MDNSPLNSAMAKLVERLTDRIFPDEGESQGNRPGFRERLYWEKSVSVLLGTIVWGWFAVQYAEPRVKATKSFGTIDEPLLYALASVGCLLFTSLIILSFERRRPLTFFFYGLLFPTLAWVLLKYSFGDLFE